MSALKIVAVNAGLCEPSSTRMLVDRLGEATLAALPTFGAEWSVIDLRDVAADVGASMAAGFATGAAGPAIAQVQEADALIVASPVFNASYSGLFKAFFDLVDVDAMNGKPVLIAATGGSPRHSMVLDHALRPLFGFLRTVVVPTGVYAASEDWAGGSGDATTLAGRIDRAAGQLAALLGERERPAASISTVSAAAGPSSAEAAGMATFARLLSGN
ncbi:NAD(P)H-dependent oxidoreductase [Gordonia alkaliphila]|uniref:CE1759 family FMN reductase n=1 Tax=Gordonia alkaliphila TaxID=1053547 RepID=UPI001FF5D769|nr:CE1759 family FMN reductase [Gordonia alkaliphila]MCK0438356.1 NAD(P)H-dependent oxidoreductase [Gordonia alkaliphila]